jgi:hypothetical protein
MLRLILTVTITLLSLMGLTAQAPDRVVTLSLPGEAAIDPEILPGGDWLTYTSREGGEWAVWAARLDPATGLFVVEGGKDVLVDTGATRPIETFNGPEFGTDASGWALYYTKPDTSGIAQIWRATIDASGAAVANPLTSGPRHQTQLVTRDPAAASTHVAAIQGTWESGTAVWFDTANPNEVQALETIEPGVIPLRWVDGSQTMVRSIRTGAQRGQIALLDTATGMEMLITSDAGDKTDPYGWFAPEHNGALLVLAVVDNEAIAVYRDLGGAHWERIATLRPPQESRFDFVASAEPFVVNGRSYMSLIVKSATSNRQAHEDSEVWLLGLGDDAAPGYQERCDSGEVGVARSDPEVYIGDDHVYVFYNVLSGGDARYEMRRCQSDLVVETAALLTSQPTEISAGRPVCQWMNPQDTDARINTATEPHYVCRDAVMPPRDHLLVFYPGTGAQPERYMLFVEEAAAMGLHAVGLNYPNERSVNLQICPRDRDPDCHEHVRQEVLMGTDLHGGVNVDAANSIENRLVQLLRTLHEAEPEAGWGQYLNGDAPAWDRIIVAGHSQGGGMAAYAAHTHEVARAILFGWTDVARGQVAPWILEAHATPGDRIYIFESVEDHQRARGAREAMAAAFGADANGTAVVDGAIPPYGGAQVLYTDVQARISGPRESSAAHNVVVVDDYTPLTNGVPALRDAWRTLLDVP